MHEGSRDGGGGNRLGADPARAPAGEGTLLRTMHWQDLGHVDPHLPPACVIGFSPEAFTLSAFERHGIPLSATLRRAVPKRQAEFLVGRVAARRAIERLGIEASVPGVGASREPLWQAGVTGSITHTDGVAAAVAVASSTVQGVGIDMEAVIDASARDAVRELAVTPGEQALLESRQGHLSAATLLTIAFSAKESFFKGTFATVGRYFDFKAVRLASLDVGAGCLTLTLAETLCPSLPEGRSFTLCFRMLSADMVATSFVW